MLFIIFDLAFLFRIAASFGKVYPNGLDNKCKSETVHNLALLN